MIRKLLAPTNVWAPAESLSHEHRHFSIEEHRGQWQRQEENEVRRKYNYGHLVSQAEKRKEDESQQTVESWPFVLRTLTLLTLKR